jgi:hypothetical protein
MERFSLRYIKCRPIPSNSASSLKLKIRDDRFEFGPCKIGHSRLGVVEKIGHLVLNLE